MNKEQIEKQLSEIREARKGKRGRIPNEERARIAALEAQLKEFEMEETAEEVAEEKAPTGMVAVEIVCDNLCIPHRDATKLVYKGARVEVPAAFAEAMGERVKVI